ncbi:MAG: PIN domain-containing protein [Pseudonocardiaceae bacterium]
MTVVLDSWAVLCLLQGDGPGAERVERVLADRPVMSWINLGEVLYILLRRRGQAEAVEAVRDLRATLSVELPTESVVRHAAAIKAAHPMAYADAFAAATTIAHDGRLWTGDPELLVPGAPWNSLDLRGEGASDGFPR